MTRRDRFVEWLVANNLRRYMNARAGAGFVSGWLEPAAVIRYRDTRLASVFDAVQGYLFA